MNENFTNTPKDDIFYLYSYHKIANGMQHESSNKHPIVSAFKANAIMQVSHLLSIDKAQARYYKLVENLRQRC